MDPMLELVENFAKQLEDAITIGERTFQRPSPTQIQNVALLGLGGSAFGGELTRNLLEGSCRVPFTIHRSYSLPGYVGPNTLVLACSYSGNTEETLEATAEALKRNATVVCITSGGKLAELATENELDIFKLPEGYPPRAAVGFALVQQLFILKFYGLAADFKSDLQEAIKVVKDFKDWQDCKNLAKAISGAVPIIYAADSIDGLAIRLRQQINENGKQLCWHHVVPEMNHNELVGWQLPKAIIDNAVVIFLRSEYEHPRVKRRFEINDSIIRPHTPNIHTIGAKGKSKLAQMMYLLHFIDWVSIYLANANNVDATPVQVIDYLKGELAKS